MRSVANCRGVRVTVMEWIGCFGRRKPKRRGKVICADVVYLLVPFENCMALHIEGLLKTRPFSSRTMLRKIITEVTEGHGERNEIAI
jgi:hypothetical protein